MVITAENILLIGSILLFISILTTRAGFRFGVPTLLLFLFVGMLAGNDGLGIEFSNPKTAQFIGVIALIVILFSGGMDTKYSEVRPVAKEGLLLATLGVLITALITALFIYWASALIYPEFGFNFLESFLLASVMSSTDSASVFSILRNNGLKLKYNLRPTLELESGSNDPMAYMLTIVLIQAITSQQAATHEIVITFFYQLMVGAVCGFLLGKVCAIFLKKAELKNEALYPILILSFAFFIFAATDFIKGNGYLAVYIGGLVVGNTRLLQRKKLPTRNFFDGLAWLAQIIMFLSLGLLVNPHELLPVAGIGLMVGGFMILFSRPLAVILCLLPFRKIKLNARIFVSWVGLRGAVPIIFATYPWIAGVPHADAFFNIVFFITIVSLIIQGTTIPMVARFLHLAEPEVSGEKREIDVYFDEEILSATSEMIITKDSLKNGNVLSKIEIPENTLVIMIKRKDKIIVPRGNTHLHEGDRLLVISDNEDALQATRERLKGRPD